MSIAKLTKLIDIHEQIRRKKTGTPVALAKKLGISERSLYYYIKELRKMGDRLSTALWQKAIFIKKIGSLKY